MLKYLYCVFILYLKFIEMLMRGGDFKNVKNSFLKKIFINSFENIYLVIAYNLEIKKEIVL